MRTLIRRSGYGKSTKAVLDFVGIMPNPMKISEISAATGVNRWTVRSALIRHNYIRMENGTWGYDESCIQ